MTKNKNHKKQLIECLKGYGYEVIQMPDRDGLPSKISDLFDVYYSFERYVKYKLMTEKAIFIIYCNDNTKQHPFYTFLKNSMPNDIIDILNDTERCNCPECGACREWVPSILMLDGIDTFRGMVLQNYNMIRYLFLNHYVKGLKNCEICFEEKKQFKKCYRCENEICADCFKKLKKVVCPYCTYDILEHLENDD